jgi:hypothetical protein
MTRSRQDTCLPMLLGTTFLVNIRVKLCQLMLVGFAWHDVNGERL